MPALVLDHCLVLHVPKTGGTWVTSALEAQGLVRAKVYSVDDTGHPTAATLAAVSSRPRIATIREPLRWLESYWRFFLARAWRPGEAPMLKGLLDLAAPDFQTFAARYVTRRPGYLTRHFQLYVEGAAYVCRQETLRVDLARALEGCGQPYLAAGLATHPVENVSRRFDVCCDPQTAQQIRHAERWVIEQFYPEQLPS